MAKIQVICTDDFKQLVEAEAEKRHLSVSALTRIALLQMVAAAQEKQPDREKAH